MIPSLVDLVWGNEFLYGVHIMLQSTVNNCYYSNFTTTGWVELHRRGAFIGYIVRCRNCVPILVLLCFIKWCKIHVFCIGKEEMAIGTAYQSTSSTKLRQ